MKILVHWDKYNHTLCSKIALVILVDLFCLLEYNNVSSSRPSVEVLEIQEVVKLMKPSMVLDINLVKDRIPQSSPQKDSWFLCVQWKVYVNRYPHNTYTIMRFFFISIQFEWKCNSRVDLAWKSSKWFFKFQTNFQNFSPTAQSYEPLFFQLVLHK